MLIWPVWLLYFQYQKVVFIRKTSLTIRDIRNKTTVRFTLHSLNGYSKKTCAMKNVEKLELS